MRTVTSFALLLCLFVVLEVTWAAKKPKKLTFMKKTVAVKKMQRPLTNKQIQNLQPKIDGIPKGTISPHRLTGLANKNNKKRPTIIGGQPAPRNRYPWMCGIILDASYFCAGSVISPKFVMTNAHCIFDIGVFVVFMGSINILDPVDSVTSVSFTSYVHPDFDIELFANDIGLIELPHEIHDTYITAGIIRPIRLPSRTQAYKTFEGRLATVIGWGETFEGSDLSSVLQFVSVPIISNEECAGIFGDIISSSMMCTWVKDDVKGPCNGDSGGALQVTECDNIRTVIGLVSFGSTEGCSIYPEVYTRVSGFLTWISEITGLAIRE